MLLLDKFRVLSLWGVLLIASAVGAFRAEAAPRIVPTEGFNLVLTETSAQKVVARPAQPGFAHNWFAARFDGLTPRVETTIKVEMEGNDVVGNKMNVGKWNGLRPMFTYADPNLYESYVGYWRDEQGSWWSLDPFLNPQQKFAGNGQVPTQRAMHPALAPLFLGNEGTTWFPWAEIENAKPGAKQSFTIKQTFYAPGASVAMRVPYTPRYLEQYVTRLKAANKSGVFVDEIGKSLSGRSLWCIRVEDPTGFATGEDIRTIAVFAREHATEHATSWSVQGLLERLMDGSQEMDELRGKVRFLLVPLQDPDGVVMNRFEGLTDNWDDPKNNARLGEVLAYSGYFRDYMDKGHTLDLAVSIHNVEANEADNFMAPFVQRVHRERVTALNREVFDPMKEAGYTVSGPAPHSDGAVSSRLYGWIALRLGAMDVAYEVNDRDPESRLSVPGLEHLGALLGEGLGRWMLSPAGDKRHAEARKFVEERIEKRTQFLQAQGEPRNDQERAVMLLLKGF